jgi:hypothetical protein
MEGRKPTQGFKFRKRIKRKVTEYYVRGTGTRYSDSESEGDIFWIRKADVGKPDQKYFRVIR